MINKLSYLLLLISLNTGYLLAWLLGFVAPLIPKKKKKDLFLFPDKQKGSDGYLRRFQEYFPYLLKDGITFDVADIYDHDFIVECENGPKWKRYWIYHKLFWKRFSQVLEARHYKAVFIHRKLFPYYPDQKKPNLLRLLNKLNNNITLDYWDAVYMYEPIFVRKSVKMVNKLSLVNQYLFNYFQQIQGNKFIWPMGVNLARYRKKENYKISGAIKLIWVGLPNFNNIKVLQDPLTSLANKYNVELMLICKEIFQIRGIKIRHFTFNLNTFFDLMLEADIGLYPLNENHEIANGKMAMKPLDYMATGLPVVGSRYGLSPFAKNRENILFADDEKGWEIALTELFENHDLREKIGRNARNMVEMHHDLEESYSKFKEIIFS